MEAHVKQIEILAVLCAKRMDVLMQIYDGHVCVYVETNPDCRAMVARWDDDAAIAGFIHELTFGQYARNERKVIQNERIIGKAA